MTTTMETASEQTFNRLVIGALICTTPRFVTTETNQRIISFRVANNDGKGTNWLTANAFDEVADQALNELEKGKRVLLFGTLRVRDWDNGERSGTTAEIEFDDYEVLKPKEHNCNCSSCESNQ
jgi:single-strand DNA-binding protein